MKSDCGIVGGNTALSLNGETGFLFGGDWWLDRVWRQALLQTLTVVHCMIYVLLLYIVIVYCESILYNHRNMHLTLKYFSMYIHCTAGGT